MAKTNSIITIGREFGSGGKEIAELLSKKLEIPLYDKEMLDRAAKESGLCQELFESNDEKPSHSFLYSLVMDTYSMNYSSGAFNEMPLNHKIFLAQFEAIKNIAKEGPCVLLGRCADYALESRSDVIRVFITADLDARIRRTARLFDLTDAKAKEMVAKTDKQRASYYNYFTNKKWGEASSYDYSLNSSMLGIENTVELIAEIAGIKDHYEKKPI